VQSMNSLGKLFFLIICLVSPVWALSDPQLIVKGTADQLMREVRLKKVELEADPQKVYLLADKYASPYFDYSVMTQSAVGSFWRQASDKQKLELINQFKQLLVRTYGTALLGMSSDLSIEYPPYHFEEGQTAVMVPTRMQLQGAPAVPVNYRAVLRNGLWKVIDITIDGISLVTNYRSSFKREIQIGASKVKGSGRTEAGIDRLIRSLAAKNAS
jgi:phospholipid transport system substrate-binding protein